MENLAKISYIPVFEDTDVHLFKLRSTLLAIRRSNILFFPAVLTTSTIGQDRLLSTSTFLPSSFFTTITSSPVSKVWLTILNENQVKNSISIWKSSKNPHLALKWPNDKLGLYLIV